jgi:hypothetical protein
MGFRVLGWSHVTCRTENIFHLAGIICHSRGVRKSQRVHSSVRVSKVRKVGLPPPQLYEEINTIHEAPRKFTKQLKAFVTVRVIPWIAVPAGPVLANR